MLRRDNKCSILESEKVRIFIILFGAILMKESFSCYSVGKSALGDQIRVIIAFEVIFMDFEAN